MKKERILQKDHSEYVRSERDVLTSVVHPYIVNLRCSFQVGRQAGVKAGQAGVAAGGARLCASTRVVNTAACKMQHARDSAEK
eukprot:1158802-Pelagomonas_calceolata.AAC.6